MAVAVAPLGVENRRLAIAQFGQFVGDLGRCLVDVDLGQVLAQQFLCAVPGEPGQCRVGFQNVAAFVDQHIAIGADVLGGGKGCFAFQGVLVLLGTACAVGKPGRPCQQEEEKDRPKGEAPLQGVQGLLDDGLVLLHHEVPGRTPDAGDGTDDCCPHIVLTFHRLHVLGLQRRGVDKAQARHGLVNTQGRCLGQMLQRCQVGQLAGIVAHQHGFWIDGLLGPDRQESVKVPLCTQLQVKCSDDRPGTVIAGPYRLDKTHAGLAVGTHMQVDQLGLSGRDAQLDGRVLQLLQHTGLLTGHGTQLVVDEANGMVTVGLLCLKQCCLDGLQRRTGAGSRWAGQQIENLGAAGQHPRVLAPFVQVAFYLRAGIGCDLGQIGLVATFQFRGGLGQRDGGRHQQGGQARRPHQPQRSDGKSPTQDGAAGRPSGHGEGRVLANGRSVVVSVGPVGMAVGHLFGRGRVHIGDLDPELQVHACQGVVGIEQDLGSLDLDHAVVLFIALVVGTLQVATDLDAGREAGFGDGAAQALVAHAEGVGCTQRKGRLKALFLALQGLFDLGQGVAIAAMQVGRGFLGSLHDSALGVGDFELDGDDGVFVNFHGSER